MECAGRAPVFRYSRYLERHIGWTLRRVDSGDGALAFSLFWSSAFGFRISALPRVVMPKQAMPVLQQVPDDHDIQSKDDEKCRWMA
jgi:hypothetical protein